MLTPAEAHALGGNRAIPTLRDFDNGAMIGHPILFQWFRVGFGYLLG